MADLPRNEAEVLIGLRKFVHGDFILQPRKNHAGYLAAAIRPEDEFDATIPGVTIEIEVKAPTLIATCLNMVSVYQLRNGVKYRAHQIEVQPMTKRSHNGPTGPIYGPHEHRGDSVEALRDVPLSCDTSLDEFFAVFCSRSNISFSGKIVLP
jgi:hypothetical protein